MKVINGDSIMKRAYEIGGKVDAPMAWTRNTGCKQKASFWTLSRPISRPKWQPRRAPRRPSPRKWRRRQDHAGRRLANWQGPDSSYAAADETLGGNSGGLPDQGCFEAVKSRWYCY